MSACNTVYVLGAPGHVGGADTELWHTLRLWRNYGLGVALVPTWGLADEWQRRCRGIGCTVHLPRGPGELLDVPGLRGALVVSFCNKHFLDHAAALRDAGCRTVWVSCMTWPFDAEREHYRARGLFDHHVFQSRYQRSQLLPMLEQHGFRPQRGSVIRGAFALDEFPFDPLPHRPGEPLVIGRLSRPDADKYAANTWSVYGRINHPIRARLMAFNRRIQRKLGRPPVWAECLAANREPARAFLAKLHVMVQINGGAAENWPRSGLEAMAAGVPIVAQNRWGWPEMIRHGETGFLADTDDDLARYATRLAREEPLRLDLARAARQSLVQELAPPERLWAEWSRIFATLEQTHTKRDCASKNTTTQKP